MEKDGGNNDEDEKDNLFVLTRVGRGVCAVFRGGTFHSPNAENGVRGRVHGKRNLVYGVH